MATTRTRKPKSVKESGNGHIEAVPMTEAGHPPGPSDEAGEALTPRGTKVRGPRTSMPGAKPGAGKDVPDVTSIEKFLLTAMRFVWLRVTIVGRGELITNRPSERTKGKIARGQSGEPKAEKAPREPDLEALEAAHICRGRYDLSWKDKNLYGFPAVGLKKAIAAAGNRFGGAKSKVMNLGAISINGPYDGLVPLYGPDGEPARYHRRTDPVPIQSKGPQQQMSLAYRPGFPEWMMTLDIRFAPSVTSKAQLLHYIYLTGEMVGIGSWRQERGGERGTFKILAFEELPDDYEPVRYDPVSGKRLGPVKPSTFQPI